MQLDLSGLRALVTGSTAGIGRAIAVKLADAGAEVAINGRTEARVQTAIQAIKADRAALHLTAAPGDLSTAAGCAAVIASAGDVDILVNNAGWFEPRPAFEISDEDWTKAFELNVMSAVRLTRHYGPKMRDKGWGRIVMISSESGIQIPTEMIHYGFSKTALLALTRGFAQALKASGVTVNAVLPGPTRSDGVAGMLQQMADGQGRPVEEVERDFFKTARPSSLIQRLASVEEVADVVAFVCSREASVISGAPVRADGGVVLSIT